MNITTEQAIQVLIDSGVKLSVEGTWSDIAVSIIAAIVGGLFTVGALWYTIRHERKENFETRRLEIMPIFTYKVVEELPDNARVVEWSFSTQKDIPLIETEMIVVNIEIKNVGMAQCPQFNFLARKHYYNNKHVYKTTYDNFYCIDKTESVYIQLTIFAHKNELQDKHFWYSEHINLAYTNVLTDCYEHSIDVIVSNKKEGNIIKKVNFIGYAIRRDMSIYSLHTYYQNVMDGIIIGYDRHIKNEKKKFRKGRRKDKIEYYTNKLKDKFKSPK